MRLDMHIVRRSMQTESRWPLPDQRRNLSDRPVLRQLAMFRKQTVLRPFVYLGGAATLTVVFGIVPSALADSSVRTQSGNTRCEVGSSRVVCQYLPGFSQAPVEPPPSCPPSPGTYLRCGGPGIHWDLAEVTSTGAFRWDDGNIPGTAQAMANDLVLNYGQIFHVQGWTISPGEDGTRFSNDGTGHGMFVSIDNVSSF